MGATFGRLCAFFNQVLRPFTIFFKKENTHISTSLLCEKKWSKTTHPHPLLKKVEQKINNYNTYFEQNESLRSMLILLRFFSESSAGFC
jgi:hypothetical protein